MPIKINKMPETATEYRPNQVRTINNPILEPTPIKSKEKIPATIVVQTGDTPVAPAPNPVAIL
ncbi:MAG: hypothetical protein JWR03_2724 [Cohnella sp.]|nr:hypothetical protein [Cohnella sp.]